MSSYLSRNKLDEVLVSYCKQIGVSYTTIHDDAFCVQGAKGYWLYLWYDGDSNLASSFIKEIEVLIRDGKLNIPSKS